MKEFSDSLRTSELEHLWLNMFNYFRKYICVNASELNKLNEEENETATISNFLYLFTLHVTKTFSFNTLNNNQFKNRKEN